MIFRVLGLSVALGMGATFATIDARAMPVSRDLAAAVSDSVIAVRDGCGRGYRWSNRRQACVPQDVYGPGPGYGAYGPPPRQNNDAAAAAAAAAVTLGVIGAIAGSQRGGGRGPRAVNPGPRQGGGGPKNWKKH